jgi:hypothetical protein
MSWYEASVLPLLRPTIRYVFVSDAVNSTKPSPDTICCVDTAPEFTAVAVVLVSEFPLIATPTGDIHTTASLPGGGGGGVGGVPPTPDTTAPLMVPPRL